MSAHNQSMMTPARLRREMRRARRAGHPRRNGTASLLAMLYLMIFASLALGFYAQTNVSAQISANERNAAKAMNAADSGMAFMRYKLAELATPYGPEANLLRDVADQLYELMADSQNLTQYALEVGMSDAGDAVLIPRDENAVIPLGNGTGFRCSITRNGRRLVVQIVGRTGVDDRTGVVNAAGVSTLGKGIEYTYEPQQIPAPIFDYGVVGRGQIELSGNGDIKGGTRNEYGNVLTTTTTNPAVITGSNGQITGKVIMTNPSATTSYHTASFVGGSNTVAGRTAATIKPPDPRAVAPEFPVIDTGVYLPFVKRNLTSVTAGAKYKNFRIPPNTPLTFSDNILEGVIYVEAPNIITFNGTTIIRGVVVTPNTATTAASTTNALNFAGQVTAYSMATLGSVTTGGYDMSIASNRLEFPTEELQLSGASVMAPGFKVSMAGGYASIAGSIIADQIAMAGNAGGFIHGSLIQLNKQKLTVTGTGGVTMERPTSTLWPAGMYFRSYYVPTITSYREFPAPRLRATTTTTSGGGGTSGGSTSGGGSLLDPITGLLG